MAKTARSIYSQERIGETFYTREEAVKALRPNPDSELFIADPTDGASALNTAIGKCVADRGDVVLVLPGSHNVTAPALFNKRGITVVSAELGMAEVGEKFTVSAHSSYTDGPVGVVSAPCRIVGLGFAGRSLEEESLLIDSGGAGGFSGGFSSLEYCRFSAWFGAIDAGVRMKGGALNHLLGCSFDGLFGGFGTAAIIGENSGAIAPAFTRIQGCRFSGVGSGKHAVVHAAGSVPVGVNYLSNVMDAGFSGDIGKFLDNNNVASTGLIADNWLGGLANKGAAFENLTNSDLKFADNHYEEA
jgi:hypothetical protein